ncbi:MAG: AAA family ATPase, partial [Prevotellaceae bacterium]|nr:AAA family ATPase [Prevotellaceae bacterium]
MAATIKIRNVGPVKEADFDLNKINVFMGPQSSGKSTIAKIISYCAWVEKDVATSQSLETYQRNDNYFIDRLESFHKLKKYFKTGSYIFYKNNVIELEYNGG